ncbi:MAG: tetratricopeptide repeat protein [Mycobacteriaceae bacterium]
MSTPNNPGHSHGAPSAPDRFSARAVDLGALKEASDQRQRAAERTREEATSGARVPRSAEVTAESFEQDLVVRSTQVAVVLLLGSPRAEGCEQMAAEFTRLAEAQDDGDEPVQWVFRQVNVDTTPEIAQALQVQAVPTVLALAAGRPLTSFEGVQPAEQVEQFVEAVVRTVQGRLPGLPEAGGDTAGESDQDPLQAYDGDDADAEAPGDPRFDAAAELLEEEDYGGAVAVYDRIISESAADPDNPEAAEAAGEAAAAKVTALLLQRTAAGTADEIDAMLLEGRRTEAFDTLIDRIRVNAGDERDAARDRLLEVFSMYDSADPEVIDARTRMASALF